MQIAYIVVTVVAAILYGYAAVLNFTHNESIVAVSERLDVPTSWMNRLGVLLTAGAIGLLVGLAWPVAGIAACVGLVP